MAFSPDGILFVSLPSTTGLYTGNRSGGKVLALPDRDQDGKVDEVMPVIEGLNNLPHGLAFYDGHLYVAAEDSVSRYSYLGDGKIGEGEVIVGEYRWPAMSPARSASALPTKCMFRLGIITKP